MIGDHGGIEGDNWAETHGPIPKRLQLWGTSAGIVEFFDLHPYLRVIEYIHRKWIKNICQNLQKMATAIILAKNVETSTKRGSRTFQT